MLPDDVYSVCQRQPFQPFTLHLADGRSLPVLSREFIIAWPEGQTIIVAQPDGKYNIVDLLLVTDLEVNPGARSPSGNGRHS
jgi:hypothetical protein